MITINQIDEGYQFGHELAFWLIIINASLDNYHLPNPIKNISLNKKQRMGRLNVSAPTSNEKNVFIHQLLDNITQLENMINAGDLNEDIQRIGAEQELCFVDKFNRPSPIIMPLLEILKDDHYTVEHAKFNGEINIDPIVLKNGCLYALENQLQQHLTKLENGANTLNSKVVLAGILPTIRKSDLTESNLTPIPRYKILNKLLKKLRGEPYEFRIEGVDLLIDRQDSTMFESSTTSFQTHLQLKANEFVPAYNWAQAITGPVLSCATNAPLFFGKRLWRETRIALFQQSLDIRSVENATANRVPRVSFGTDWLHHSPVEIFKEDIARHRAILSTAGMNPEIHEDPPRLNALSIHNGTIYRWNRPCYGITNNKPHLRIENRYIPAGPTVVDEVANAAFWVGLMTGLPERYKNINRIMNFEDARSNFVKAARMGLGAQFKWPGISGRITASTLILQELIPIAIDGLKSVGLKKNEISKYLNIITERVKSESTGSQWMIDNLTALKTTNTLEEALATLTAGLIKRQKENIPVHQWSSIDQADTPKISLHQPISQIMSTDLFSVHENDSILLVANIMNWRQVHHIPVINNEGHLIGLITADKLLAYFGKFEADIKNLNTKDLMHKKPIVIHPKTEIGKAIDNLQQHNVRCLPVVENDILVGMVSEKDIVKLATKFKRDDN